MLDSFVLFWAHWHTQGRWERCRLVQVPSGIQMPARIEPNDPVGHTASQCLFGWLSFLTGRVFGKNPGA